MERSFGERVPKFSDSSGQPSRNLSETEGDSILEWMRENEIGRNELIDTPFGKRQVCYCDYAASGRALADIEQYIRHEVLPILGNTHSSITTTSEQSTLFLHEARDIIRNAVGASEHDAVLFTGNGTTAAVELLMHLLALETVIVVSGVHEHHSSVLPWREIASDYFIIDETNDGCVDLKQLDRILRQIRETKGEKMPIVGCFTAASNVTVCYCDYAASGRALADIEQYIRHEVLPILGNTHSSITTTSEQSTLFLHEARDIIRNAVGASEHDAVLFTGNGTTAAVELLMHLLALETVIVVSGVHEHHSSVLPWREIASDYFIIDETNDGCVDLKQLDRILRQIRETKGEKMPIVGCFTAASNVTGICVDVEAITTILKRWNCIALWDYAAAAPYVDIKMNGKAPKDALYFSGHKFSGGIQTPGVLIVKKQLIASTRPKRIGGGTVFFVSRTSRSYLKEVEYREEGGTPDVVGVIRLALAFKLKAAVGTDLIKHKEARICEYVIKRLTSNEHVILLGPAVCRSRLAVFSFVIRERLSQLFLHYNLVSALLNDLFGIQSRSGCACAGPYAQHLLGIGESLALRYRDCLAEDCRLDRVHLRRNGEYSQREMLRPGFTRISIPFFLLSQLSCFDVYLQLSSLVRKATVKRWSNVMTLEGFFCAFSVLALRYRDCLAEDCRLDRVHLRRNGEYSQREMLRPGFTRISIPFFASDKMLALRYRDCLAEDCRLDRVHLRRNGEYSQREMLRPGFTRISIPFFASDKMVEFIVSAVEFIAANATRFIAEKQEMEGEHKSAGSLVAMREELGECALTCCFNEEEQGEGIDDWNRRVVVIQRDDVTEEEKMRQPWVTPPLELYKRVTEAIHSLNMIQDGDRVLVCLSGGKDSLSLLHVLHHYQQRAMLRRKNTFRLGAITVDPGSAAYNPRPLIDYCRALNIDYFYEEQNIIGQAARLSKCRSICAFCSRMKRGRIATAAKLHGYNVLAMGHHLDDLAESFLIAAFQNGNLSTMKAVYVTRDSALRVIRPLIYVREKALREFGTKSKW
ncbi:tRNA 2-thiocytidine biosynthesis protein TtcA [Toxocara canis]|uniref:tRNA 2-thiocytidine biosynthesis protein TtcA n=1 Tax=Toxocara canis TaxID=6265 RepID=A0A0B2VV75_TOXCA|nr:tRNA 2-thiocytidine biosynthesis protein TtcA [Toxocara canis]